ncbi:MAG: metal ABC transporter permease [Longimonas sp.]|uniref:metal ABC transporter permease n=1 Tax=Longimonas sp. TaxID=2039626 RepID=UPI003347B90E
MSPQVEVQLVAAVTAVACALPGAFLVLRRMAMMSDAITHAILPGIVVGFFLTESLGSPLLLVGAALTGLLTVALVESIERTGLVREDAAIGIVFPILFSIGVILIARYAGDVHLDLDAVLLGELAFAPFNRLELFGSDLGPRALWVMGTVLLLNAAFLFTFYKELKLATFDPVLAAALGFMPGVLHYALMGMVSITAVSAFDAVGAILVVALMVGPPATAYLLTDRLDVMIGLSAALGVANALIGYAAAAWLDASIAGSMATVAGLLFGLAFLLAPERGLVAQQMQQRTNTARFAEQMLAAYLCHPQTRPLTPEAAPKRLYERFGWSAQKTDAVLEYMCERGTLTRRNGAFACTEHGESLAAHAMPLSSPP